MNLTYYVHCLDCLFTSNEMTRKEVLDTEIAKCPECGSYNLDIRQR